MPLDIKTKPGISEVVAFQVMTLAKAETDPVKLQRATALLADYKAQQESAGEPIFPEWERSQREELEQTRKHFTDRERHGLNDEMYREVAQTYANDPEGKAKFFNDKFLARTYGKPVQDIRPIGAQYRDEYSTAVWGEKSPSDTAFAERLAQDFEVEDAANDWAQEAALKGLDPLKAQILPPELAENPAFKRREKEFRAQQETTYRATSARIAPYRQLIDETRASLAEKAGVKPLAEGETKSNFSELAANLIDVPKKDRGLVMAAIIASKGDEESDPSDKGRIDGAPAVINRRMAEAQKLAENFGRGARDLGIDSVGFSERDMLQQIRNEIAGGASPSPGQSPGEFVAGLRASILDSGAIIGTGITAAKTPNFADMSEAQKMALAEIDRRISALDISKTLRQISDEEIDPAKSEWKIIQGIYDATRSLPYMAAAAAGVPGFIAVSSSLAEESYFQLREANPGMSEAQALQLSGPAGLIKGALEKIPVKILQGRLPGLERFLNKPIATLGGVGGRVGVRVAGATALEMGQENLQDLTPFVGQSVVSALAEDMPETPWREVFGNMAENQTALFFATLPLALIGAGAGTYQDYQGAAGFMADYDLLRAAGVSEAGATSIRVDSLRGRLGAAQATLRAEFRGLKTSTQSIEKTRAEIATKAIKAKTERMEAIIAAEKIDLLPAIRAEQGGGYSLQFSDGTAGAKQSTYEEADAARWQYASDNQISIHEATRNVIRRVDSQIEEGREVKYVFDLKRKTLADEVDEGGVSQAAAENRADIAEQQNFETDFREAETVAKLSGRDRLASTVIIGSNVTEFRDGVQRTVVRLYQDASPLTVIEEKVEGDVALMLKATGGREWLRSSLREYEQISGDSLFLAGKSDEDLTDGDLKEAFSDLATAYFVGRSRKGLAGNQWGERRFRETASKLMRGKIGDALTGYGHFFRAVWRRAAKINRLKREGALPARLEEELARSTGMLEQGGYNQSVIKEAQGLLEELPFPEIAENSEPSKPMEPLSDDAPFSVMVDPNAAIAKMFSPFQRNPELRRKLVLDMQARAQKVARDWAGVIAANRSKQQIASDAKEVEGELIGAGLLNLSETEKATIEGTAEPVSTPILDIVKRERMRSRSGAKKAGIDLAEYDDMPDGIPPGAFGGTLGPDQVAKIAGFENLGEFWQALGQEIESAKSQKEEAAKIKAKVKGIEADAKEEAGEFAKYLQRQRETVGSDRATLLGALRTLDAILSVLPPEVRGKIGGFVALAELTKPKAMLDEIEKRTVAIDRELERYLSREADKGVKKLFERVAKAKETGAGKKAKGLRNSPGMFKLFEALAKAKAEYSADEGRAEADKLQGLVDAGSIPADRVQDTLIAVNLIPLFSGWKGRMEPQVINGKETRVRVSTGAGAAQKTQALEAATLAWKGGLAAWAAEQEAIAARREAIRERAIVDVLTTSGAKTKDEQAIFDESRTGLARKAGYSLMSYDGLLSWFMGQDSQAYKDLVDGERTAANAYHDGMQRINSGVEDLFTALGRGSLEGRQLQFRMAQKEIKITDALGNELTISQNEAITALLMWRQDDGRRHMEGRKDDDGNVIGSWSYDQDFIDELSTRITPEGWEVYNYLVAAYSREYEPLNQVYRAVNGIDLPQNKNYSPITVQPERELNQGVDPLTGFFGGGLSGIAGSLRSRGASTVEPDFKDALKVFIAHSMQMEHYKAFAEYSKETRAILGAKTFRDAIQRAGGKDAVSILGDHLEVIDQGGTRDAGQQLALSKWLGQVGGRLSQIILFGKLQTVVLNASQLGAAAVDMPAGQYLRQLSKLFTGRLNWLEALDTPYIRRRIEQMPPVVRQALEAGQGMPNRLNQIAEGIGYGITGSDGLFTAGTYVMVLDHQRTIGARMGMTGADLDTWARNETERIVDRVAQPTRQGARSIIEIRGTVEQRVLWTFASESRKNLGLMIAGFSNRSNRQRAIGTAIYTILFGAVLTSLFRSAWRDSRDDDDDDLFDEKNWSPANMAWSVATDWMGGVPFAGDIARDALLVLGGQKTWDGTILDAPKKGAIGVKNLYLWDYDRDEWDRVLADIQAIIAGAGTANKNAASIAGIANAVVDAAKVVKNLNK
jgi:hypothetical protein